jgi:hypothetical protein
MQLLAGPMAPRALRSQRARADPQMAPPVVRGITVAQPELLAVFWRVPRMGAAQGHRVAEGWELRRVDLQLPALGLPVLGLAHPQAVLRRNLARERVQL